MDLEFWEIPKPHRHGSVAPPALMQSRAEDARSGAAAAVRGRVTQNQNQRFLMCRRGGGASHRQNVFKHCVCLVSPLAPLPPGVPPQLSALSPLVSVERVRSQARNFWGATYPCGKCSMPPQWCRVPVASSLHPLRFGRSLCTGGWEGGGVASCWTWCRACKAHSFLTFRAGGVAGAVSMREGELRWTSCSPATREDEQRRASCLSGTCLQALILGPRALFPELRAPGSLLPVGCRGRGTPGGGRAAIAHAVWRSGLLGADPGESGAGSLLRALSAYFEQGGEGATNRCALWPWCGATPERIKWGRMRKRREDAKAAQGAAGLGIGAHTQGEPS